MERGVIYFLITLGVLFSAVPLISAEIFVGQVGDLYNVGDELRMNATLVSGTSVTSFFSTVLVCAEGELELYRSPENIQQGKQRTISFSAKFDRAIIGNLSGNCFILVRFAGERDKSRNFEITSGINVQTSSAKSVYSPGELIYLTGSAYKKNGKAANGFVESEIEELGLKVSGLVNKGSFNVSLVIPSDSPSKNYFVKTKVYERDDNRELTNQGNSDLSIKVKQVARKLDIAVDSLSIKPGENFFFISLLIDQSGESMKEDVRVLIRDSKGETVQRKLTRSGEANILSLEKNATPGNWKIEAEFGELKAAKSWEVEELMNVSFSVSNNTLVIYNTGNVRYNKPVEIVIGDVREVKEIDLGVGENKKFRLYGPDGNYDLGVYDGIKTTELGKTYLTGDAVAVKDFEEGSKNVSSFVIWLVILALGMLTFIYGRKVIKKKFMGRVPRDQPRVFSSFSRQSAGLSGSPSSSRKLADVSSAYASKSGKREECGIVALAVRNSAELEEDAQASSVLARVIKEARDAKAAMKQDEKGLIFIFSSVKTGFNDNMLYAVKVAARIQQILLDYNKKHALRIDFGIGAHSGEMLIEHSQGNYTFYALGNSIIVAKRASERAREEILISAPAHRKTLSIVKTEVLNGENLWKVKNIVDREEHKEFLDKFMRKNH